jgi:hypothetical protein
MTPRGPLRLNTIGDPHWINVLPICRPFLCLHESVTGEQRLKLGLLYDRDSKALLAQLMNVVKLSSNGLVLIRGIRSPLDEDIRIATNVSCERATSAADVTCDICA